MEAAFTRFRTVVAVVATIVVADHAAPLADGWRDTTAWDDRRRRRTAMTRLQALESGRLDDPVPLTSFPFAHTIDVSEAASDPDEPSPCLPTARSVWYALHAPSAGRLVVDLAGSTPLDPVLRLYRRTGVRPATTVFLGCASPVWNAQLSLAAPVAEGEVLLAQVGTSESHEGRLVVRATLRE